MKLDAEYVLRETNGLDAGFECVQVHFPVRGREGRRVSKRKRQRKPDRKNTLVCNSDEIIDMVMKSRD